MYRTLAAFALYSAICISSFAQEVEFAMTEPYPEPGEYVAHEDIRRGGVLATSYAYHRTPYVPIAQPEPCIMPANGAYGWGFPVTTYRWGWFGAEHYWPRVFWYKGYYNDCCRAAYRQGY